MPVGSTYLDCYGYIRVKVVPGKGHWRLQHLLVMESLIGRPLAAGEMVHHINGARDDNRPENLHLCSSRSEHNAIERTLAQAFRELLAQGIVRFNKESAVYERVLSADGH
jgi:hypothetical protein